MKRNCGDRWYCPNTAMVFAVCCHLGRFPVSRAVTLNRIRTHHHHKNPQSSITNPSIPGTTYLPTCTIIHSCSRNQHTDYGGRRRLDACAHPHPHPHPRCWMLRAADNDPCAWEAWQPATFIKLQWRSLPRPKLRSAVTISNFVIFSNQQLCLGQATELGHRKRM